MPDEFAHVTVIGHNGLAVQRVPMEGFDVLKAAGRNEVGVTVILIIVHLGVESGANHITEGIVKSPLVVFPWEKTTKVIVVIVVIT